MATITIMDRKEMRKIKDALHIDVRDGRLYVWGMFNQTVCIYPEEISAYDPDEPQTTGTLTVRLPDTPPSPPADENKEYCRRVKGRQSCLGCDHANSCSPSEWKSLSNMPPIPCVDPPEMPEVDWSKPLKIIKYIHEIDYPRMDRVLRQLDNHTFLIIDQPDDDGVEEELSEEGKKLLEEAMMPEVESDPQDAIANGAPMPLSAKVPIVLGYCAKFQRAVGKKPANSCRGCTVPGCKMKGEPMTAMEMYNAD